MFHSIREGKIIEMESKPTISDGSAGGVESNSVTFEIIQQFVDEFILVSEDEIKHIFKMNPDLQEKSMRAIARTFYLKVIK